MAASAAAPLDGVRVVEMADGWAAHCGRILDDLGVDVVKVEPPHGDSARSRLPFIGGRPGPDRSFWWIALNANKRGVTLDGAHPGASVVLRRLLERADVLVDSCGPSGLEARGLGPSLISSWNERLIHTTVTPFGWDGPLASVAASDIEVTAMSGALWLAGEPYIDLSQYEAGLQFMGPAILEHRLNGTIPARAGDHDPVAVPHGVYPSADEGSMGDRWVALSIWSDGEWERFREAIGDPAWARDPRWETAAGRRAAESELEARISEWTRGRTRGETVDALRSRGLRAAPVLSISELFADAQLAHHGFWRALPHPVIGTVECLSAPFTLSATPSRQERAGPVLGADNEAVFGAILGLGAEERATLARDGVFD